MNVVLSPRRVVSLPLPLVRSSPSPSPNRSPHRAAPACAARAVDAVTPTRRPSSRLDRSTLPDTDIADRFDSKEPGHTLTHAHAPWKEVDLIDDHDHESHVSGKHVGGVSSDCEGEGHEDPFADVRTDRLTPIGTDIQQMRSNCVRRSPRKRYRASSPTLSQALEARRKLTATPERAPHVSLFRLRSPHRTASACSAGAVAIAPTLLQSQSASVAMAAPSSSAAATDGAADLPPTAATAATRDHTCMHAITARPASPAPSPFSSADPHSPARPLHSLLPRRSPRTPVRALAVGVRADASSPARADEHGHGHLVSVAVAVAVTGAQTEHESAVTVTPLPQSPSHPWPHAASSSASASVCVSGYSLRAHVRGGEPRVDRTERLPGRTDRLGAPPSDGTPDHAGVRVREPERGTPDHAGVRVREPERGTPDHAGVRVRVPERGGGGGIGSPRTSTSTRAHAADSDFAASHADHTDHAHAHARTARADSETGGSDSNSSSRNANAATAAAATATAAGQLSQLGARANCKTTFRQLAF